MQQVSFSRLPGRYVLLLCWHDVFLRCYHIPLSQNVAPLLHPSNLQLCALMSPAVWIGDVSETSIAKVSVFLVFFFVFFSHLFSCVWASFHAWFLGRPHIRSHPHFLLRTFALVYLFLSLFRLDATSGKLQPSVVIFSPAPTPAPPFKTVACLELFAALRLVKLEKAKDGRIVSSTNLTILK